MAAAAARFYQAVARPYDARLKRQYKLSYRRVQDVLTWIEMERGAASQRKQRRRASKGAGPAVQGGGGGPP